MKTTMTGTLSPLLKYKGPLLVYTLCVAVLFGVYLFASKKIYRSEATLLLRQSKETAAPRMEQQIQNEIRFLTSANALGMVAGAVSGPQTSHRDVQKVKEYLARNFTVTAIAGSDLIALSFDFPDPLTAQKMLRALIDQYRAHRGQTLEADGRNPYQESLAAAESEYAKAEEALAEFEQVRNLFDERQLVVLNESREQLQLALNSLSNDHAYLLRKKNYIQELLQDVPREVLYGATQVMNENYIALTERLARAKGELESQLRRQRPDDQAVTRLRGEISNLETALAKEPQKVVDADEKEGRINEARDILNRQFLELLPEVEALAARMENIRAQVAEIDEALLRSAEAADEHGALRDTRDQKKAAYDAFREAYAASEGARGDGAGVYASVVASPSYNPHPVRPDLAASLPIALVLLVLGSGVILLLGPMLDTTVYRADQAEEAFKLPVLGVLEADEPQSDDQGQNRFPYFETHKGELRILYNNLMTAGESRGVILFAPLDEGAEQPLLAEGFACFAHFNQKRRAALVRYPDNRQDGKDEKPASARRLRPAGLTVYERGIINVTAERTLWEKLMEESDLLVIEYAAVREGPLLAALADYVDATVLCLEAGKSEKNQTIAKIAMLRRWGLNVAGLALHCK